MGGGAGSVPRGDPLKKESSYIDKLQATYDLEINFELTCFWDGGFTARLGDKANGFSAPFWSDQLAEVVDWIYEEALVMRDLFVEVIEE